MEKFQFPSMIEKLKQSPKTIVFTEGTDARILEAAAELLKDSFLKPILVGSEAEVKAAADYVTQRDNDHDAVVEIVEKFLL